MKFERLKCSETKFSLTTSLTTNYKVPDKQTINRYK